MKTKHLYDELAEALPDFETLLKTPSTRSPEAVWQLVANAFTLAVALQDEADGRLDRIPEHLYDISEPIKHQLRRFQQGEIIKFSSCTNTLPNDENGWISITDKLSPLDTDVLCWCDGVRIISSLFATINGFAWSGGKKVTYWKPISLDSPTSIFK